MDLPDEFKAVDPVTGREYEFILQGNDMSIVMVSPPYPNLPYHQQNSEIRALIDYGRQLERADQKPVTKKMLRKLQKLRDGLFNKGILWLDDDILETMDFAAGWHGPIEGEPND